MRIIHKTGPLANPADRDHCLEYMVAVALIEGRLTAGHYEDPAAADPRIDRLREKMVCEENPAYSRDYLDPEKRSIANAVQATFTDGTQTERAEVEYPLADGLPRRFRSCGGSWRPTWPAACRTPHAARCWSCGTTRPGWRAHPSRSSSGGLWWRAESRQTKQRSLTRNGSWLE